MYCFIKCLLLSFIIHPYSSQAPWNRSTGQRNIRCVAMPDSLPLTSVRSSRRSGFSTRTCSWRTGTNRPPNPPPSPTTAKQVCAVSDETCLAFEFPLLTSTRWNYTDILTPQSDGLRWVQLQPEINHWQTNGAGVSFSYLWMAAGRLLEGLCFYRSAGEKLALNLLFWFDTVRVTDYSSTKD